MAKGAYRKGANAERELMALAKQCGADVYRGAGSHGAYDVIITAPGRGRYLVNIKCNVWAPPAERARLAWIVRDADIPLLACRRDRKGWFYRGINGLGEMGEITTDPPWIDNVHNPV